MGRVVVVGSLNVDRPWRVARHPVVGETIEGRPLAPLPGGKGLNQAVAARRMEVEVALLGCVGGDADGRWLLEVARDEGIGVEDVQVAPDEPTGTALIVVDDAGANTVTVAPGANRSLAIGTVLIERHDVVVAQLEVPVAAIADAFDQAGRVVRGEFRPGGTEREWCDVEVLRQLRRRTLAALRREIEPVEAEAYARFLIDWQGVGSARRGIDGLVEVLGTLQGASIPASVLEADVLPARLRAYSPADLELLALGTGLRVLTCRPADQHAFADRLATGRLGEEWGYRAVLAPEA